MLYFNPRAPYGARLCTSSPKPLILIFQSTRPIRGATAWFCYLVAGAQNFNPRAPYGARPFACFGGLPCSVISIHAPHTGRDALRFFLQHSRHYFNPRAPYGARLSSRTLTVAALPYFNPRAPYGARHSAVLPQTTTSIFQSTRPIRGATTAISKGPSGQFDFNPRAPYGARPDVATHIWNNAVISIHAPHTGRDWATLSKWRVTPAFQSTRPIRGATGTIQQPVCPYFYFNPRAPYGARRYSDKQSRRARNISIHAPHTGRDEYRS